MADAGGARLRTSGDLGDCSVTNTHIALLALALFLVAAGYVVLMAN